MQQIRLDPPQPEEVHQPSEAEVADWFSAPPFEPSDALWQWLTPQAARDVSRLSGYFHRLFDYSGDWFSASRDRPERIANFRDEVLAAASPEQPIYVLHRQFEPYSGVFTSGGGFLECWPRLRLAQEEHRGFVVIPLDLSFWFQIAGTGTAHIAHRAA